MNEDTTYDPPVSGTKYPFIAHPKTLYTIFHINDDWTEMTLGVGDLIRERCEGDDPTERVYREYYASYIYYPVDPRWVTGLAVGDKVRLSLAIVIEDSDD